MPDVPSDDLLRAASAWFARLHGGDATDEHRREHETWLAEHRAHQYAYDFVVQTAAIAAHGAAGRRSRGARVAGARRFASGAGSRRRTVGWALAAGVVVAIVWAGILWNRGHSQNFLTRMGQVRTVTLQDGSILTLGPATEISVAYHRAERDLDLQRGEALFLVAKNRNRPFIVRAGLRTVTAIGTEFEVDRYGASVSVAVAHGVVAISKPLPPQYPSSKRAPALLLRKGEAVDYGAGEVIGSKHSVDPGQIGAWRTGLLAYVQAPLSRVVADLNRQFGGNITIADPKLASLTVTLTLRLRDRDKTLRTLQELLPVRALRNSSGAIRLVAAASMP